MSFVNTVKYFETFITLKFLRNENSLISVLQCSLESDLHH